MSLQAWLRQRACTKPLLATTTSIRRPTFCRRLYSIQPTSDEHPHDASSQAESSDLSRTQETVQVPADQKSTTPTEQQLASAEQPSSNFGAKQVVWTTTSTEQEVTTAEPASSKLAATQIAWTTTSTEKQLATTEQPSSKLGSKQVLWTTPTNKTSSVTRKLPKDYDNRTRVESFLSSITATGQEPTIEDIERWRPVKHAHPESEKYVEEYNALLDTLCHSFSRRQLQHCLSLYGSQSKKIKARATKKHFAVAIIEDQWGWPSLEKVQKDKRDRTEVARKQIEVMPSELFLILGRDGANLLQLSSQYKVHVSVKQDPLSLDVNGVRISVQRFSEAVKALRKSVVEETFRLPTSAPIPSELRQRVSRLAEAYIENVGDEGLVRICARDIASLNRAKRFTTRATSEILGTGHIPLVTYLGELDRRAKQPIVPDTPKQYALYPFMSPRSLPWPTDAAAYFRLRSVGEWLFSPIKVVSQQLGLAKSSGMVIANDGTNTSLKDTLLSKFAPEDSSRAVIKACLGHLLFSTKRSDELQALLGPLKGSHPYQKVQEWMSNYDQPTFVPNLPTSLVQSSPSEQKIIHRLVYRALATYHSPTEMSPRPPETALDTNESITLEVILAQPKRSPPSPEQDNMESLPLTSQVRYTHVVESPLDVMFPDRAMDIRFVVSQGSDLAESEQSSVLREYASQLHEFFSTTSASPELTGPDPPLAWTSNGKTYVLHGSYAVRRSLEPFQSATSSTTIVSESVLDLDSKQRSTSCEVICTDPTSHAGWSDFLQGCDTHVSAFYRPPITSFAPFVDDLVL